MDTAWKAGGTKKKPDPAPASPAPAIRNPTTGTVPELTVREAMILQALRSYAGPVNKKGLPKLRPLREHANLPDLTRAERNRMYEQRKDTP